MLTWIFKKFKKPKEIKKKPKKSKGYRNFSTDILNAESLNLDDINAKVFQRTHENFKSLTAGVAMDSADNTYFKDAFRLNATNVPLIQLDWYASQGFIGFQTSAILAQHWLIDKACNMPAKDAVRKGYEITVNDGTDIDPEILDKIRRTDVKYKLVKNLVEFVHMGRLFGIRIAMFKIDHPFDSDYYTKPFNIDGVTPGSYKGIVQIDPTWIVPELDEKAIADPTALDFYEPTWWQVRGLRIHRTHLIIMRNGHVADTLKPTYLFAGISIPQKIFERVYAAERTANEAPKLALSKRTTTLSTDVAQAVANPTEFKKRINLWSRLWTNFGIKIHGKEEAVNQFDTSLADFDSLTMTQYQLVAAAANVPAVKLLGTSPKGFNATGEFEEANYHEELESIQTHDLTPFLERHYALVVRSDILRDNPELPIFIVTPSWKSLDSMTALEQATLNKTKAETGSFLIAGGVIDNEDERQRLINDPDSGYNGLPEEVPVPEDAPDDPDDEFGMPSGKEEQKIMNLLNA